MNSFKITLLFLLFLPLTAARSSAQDRPILKNFFIEKSSDVPGKNQALAREQTVSKALDDIIETVVEKILRLEVLAENYLLIKENIYSKKQNYIQGYRIVSQEFDPGERIYHISLKVKVFIGNLRNDLSRLGLLPSGKKESKILVIFKQQGTEKEENFFETISLGEELLIAKLQEKGIMALDRQGIQDIISPAEIFLLQENDLSLLSFLRLQADVDFILLGELKENYNPILPETKPSDEEEDLAPLSIPLFPLNNKLKGELTVKLKLVKSESGEVIASQDELFNESGDDKEIISSLLLSQASKKISEFLSRKTAH